MSGRGVTEISSMMSRGFHPAGVSNKTPSAGVCCNSSQLKRCRLWVPGRILFDVVRVHSHNLLDTRDAPSSQATAGRQDAGPARGRRPASAPRGRPRRRLCEPSVLRPARPRAGQVRDGSPPPGRWTAGDRDRRALRGQPPDVLPDRGRVRGARDPRAGAQASRTEGGPQMHRRGCRLRRTLARGRRRATGRAADSGRGAAVRHLGSRPLARPGGGATQKKPRPQTTP